MRRVRLASAIAVPLALSAAALFFALGGAAFATGSTATKRCANGTVKGIAVVTGDKTGIANIPDKYSSRRALFGYRYSCAGKGVQVKHATSLPAYDVRFPGNPGSVGIASAVDATAAMTTVQRQPDGAFRVFLVVPAGNELAGRPDLHFSLVVF